MQDAQVRAQDAAGWVRNNWEVWLAAGLRIILILVIALVLRTVVRRTITRLIARMNRSAEATNSPLGGLLVNAERRRQRSEAIGSVLRSVSSFLILGTAALTILSVFEISLGPLLASAGVAGVALGFGARNLVTDVLSGMFILLEDQYGVGDRIDVGDVTGVVLEIGLRVTKLRGDDGEVWYVRNGGIARVGNLSQGWATANVDVEVRADEDLSKVRAAVAGAGQALAAESPWDERLWGSVDVLGLDSVSLDTMVLRVSAKTMPGEAKGVERELRLRIKEALDALGVRLVDAEGVELEKVERSVAASLSRRGPAAADGR
ncbi:mechanosensitive ion channel family protein [Streptomyces alkaliterrae]|uniref:Mechanosensitive ion channel n=1 Tax=Streptomyces alkaliterrae TaxID=2213162 RepID=A0A5P0YNH3_9ACTN|nr:mechanosensitive ion channel family protein [Streptomyces alkaliterrae]MBB1253099.1 mechanosensitive ion channel family protein [Streptomyces alkaliterrae]MBB1259628.1 mechanosensitive ion channel family protein [Streptomyces alkaliterrae]MQS00972.1 mechanosensitive ion channel [Streptomyces alkaliterrae]